MGNSASNSNERVAAKLRELTSLAALAGDVELCNKWCREAGYDQIIFKSPQSSVGAALLNHRRMSLTISFSYA